MRKRSSNRALTVCIGGLVWFGGAAAALAAETTQSAPIRLTATQMDGITAGTAVVATDASAIVVGGRGLALTSAHTIANSNRTAQHVGGGSSAVGIGSSFAATNSSTAVAVGNGIPNAALAVGASGTAGGGSAIANAFSQAVGFDSAVADVALGLARSFAGGGEGSVATATSDVGRDGGVLSGSVTRVVQTPRFSLAQATAFAATINPPAAPPDNAARSSAANRVQCPTRTRTANP